jgi:hypothetical protein
MGSPAFGQFEVRSFFELSDVFVFSVVVGDFNRDGILDLAVVNSLPFGGGMVQVMLGNGDGTFRAGDTYNADIGFYGAAASLRDNGILDLVFGGGMNSFYVMLGNGDGTFQPAVAYPASAESTMIALGKFTGSGNVDIANLEWSSSQGVVCNCVEVLPGNGDGTFGASIATMTVPYDIDGTAIAAGDFNNDGKLDLAVGGQFFSTSKVDILLGNGDGTFTADNYYTVAGVPDNIVTGHFTNDKAKLDLAVASAGEIYVLLGNGDGTFQGPAVYGEGASWVAAEDLNGDGNTDLATAGSGSLDPPYTPGVRVLYGNGDGTFRIGPFYPTAGKNDNFYVATGDFNNDGKPDLVAVNNFSEQVITLLSTGAVVFSPTSPLNFKDQSEGTTSKPKTVTLTNTGTTELKIQSMKASPEFSMTSTCGSRVAPGAQCTISATFSPTKKGSAQGMITIIDNASSKTQVIELLGTGT